MVVTSMPSDLMATASEGGTRCRGAPKRQLSLANGCGVATVDRGADLSPGQQVTKHSCTTSKHIVSRSILMYFSTFDFQGVYGPVQTLPMCSIVFLSCPSECKKSIRKSIFSHGQLWVLRTEETSTRVFQGPALEFSPVFSPPQMPVPFHCLH